MDKNYKITESFHLRLTQFQKLSSTKFKPFVSASLIGLASLTASCTHTHYELPTKEVKITAVGYGASSSYEGYTPGQKRLMAMRTSKLDAYRSLAEQVQGVRVNGNSTVSAMMTQVDSFRVLVDAYLRGAQVVSVIPMNDGNYETTMELTLDSRFFNAYTPFANNAHLSDVVVGSSVKGAVGPGFAYGSRAVGTGYAYGTNFYYSE